MGRHTADVAIIFCPIPRGIVDSQLAEWLGQDQNLDMPVTWTAPRDLLPRVRAAFEPLSLETPPAIAIDLSEEWPTTKQSLRQSLRSARTAWSPLDAAVLHGPATLDHRDVLVQEGISAIGLDGFDAPARGSRRPAPQGWPCRSILWGLWEASASEASRNDIVGRVAEWCSRGRRPARLTMLRAAADPTALTAAMLRARLDRHLAWARRRTQAGTLRVVTLSDLPTIIAGSSTLSARGSVLRAA